MANNLRNLVNSGSVRELQQKLENWQQDFERNSSGENMNRCYEILELNNEIQKRLYSILSDTSREDDCTETIRRCPMSSICCTPSRCDNLIQDSPGCELRLKDLTCNPKCRLQALEDKLTSTRIEINQMERDLTASRLGGCNSKKVPRHCDYDHRIQQLRDEMSALDAQKTVLQRRLGQNCSPSPCCASKSCSPSPCCASKSCSPSPCCASKNCSPSPCCGRKSCSPSPCCGSKSCSPSPCCVSKPCVSKPCVTMRTWSPCEIRRSCASRRACLIARFNFIYAKERLDAESILRPYVCNTEVVQKIIYVAAVESFHAAKLAFWKVKVSVKETLALHPCDGLAPVEVATLDYIACHKDLFDVCSSIHEVICAMNIHPKLPCPAEVDFIVISSLIREICCLAFEMQTLIPPLDIAVGVDGEMFNKSMYYRSFDSDFSASFVAYHVWPALLENDAVIVKGEVVTKNMIPCPRRCKIRSRSCSCGRRLLPGQANRSRSLSTTRARRR
ncbi:mitochondria-eating protein isoform X2 [Catharus ustulatus]|uniref:Mitochondria-eating protein n=1 Tax=Catharus ustulatus TaxID=91951 RepID=A0A8C3TM83_CATUS|nr:mitochondria-eating protein isoform X2 [Catharus ustulatus]